MSFAIILLASFLTSLGVGGGALTSLYFTAFLDIDIKLATTSAIILFIPTAVISVALGIKNGFVKLNVTIMTTFGGTVGAFVGFWIWNAVETALLKTIFAGFLIIFGIREFIMKKS